MAVDGDNMFIVVEASPRDYLIKVDTDGNFVTGFNSGGSAELPVNDVEGIEILGGSLYAVAMASGSCPPNCGGQGSGKLYKLNKVLLSHMRMLGRDLNKNDLPGSSYLKNRKNN